MEVEAVKHSDFPNKISSIIIYLVFGGIREGGLSEQVETMDF